MNSLRTAKRFVFPLLGLWALLYASFSLIKPPLLDGLDSIQAEAAREMVVNGDWVTPHVDGVRSFAVSPLLTWTTAVSLKLFGIKDWAARLPLAIFALALFIVTLALGTRLFLAPVAGFYAALILLTSAGIFLFAHLLFPEIVFALWVVLAVYFFWRSLHHTHASLGTAIGFGVACGLATLSQGLGGIIIPLAIVLLFLTITRNLPHFVRWHPVPWVLVFLAIGVPWHIAVHNIHALHPHFVPGPGTNSSPILLVWAFLLLWMIPWCVFSVAALVDLRVQTVARSKHMDPGHQARLLLAIWIIVVALFVALTPHQEYSIVPALPAVALLAAGWLAADEHAPSRAGRIAGWIFAAVGIAGAVVAAIVAARAPSPAPGADIGTLLQLHPGQHRFYFGHLADLTFDSMGAFRVPLIITAAALVVGVVCNLIFRLKGRARAANCFLAGMMVFLLIAADLALNTVSPVISSAILAEAIKPEVNSNDLIVVNEHYRDASALSFYLEQPIHLLNAPPNDLGRFSSDNRSLFENSASLGAQWQSGDRVFLWTTPASVPVLPGAVYLIARDGGREILSNQPNSGGASF